MPTKRRPTLTRIIAGSAEPQGAEAAHGRNLGGRLPHAIPEAMVSVAFSVILLVLATTSQGAFAISRWAPLTLFTLAVLIGALLARGRLAFNSRSVIVALSGIWGLAAWSLLSMLWAQSSASAFQAGDRMCLYAAIATLPFVVPVSRRALAAAGWSIMVGISGIALYVLVRLLIDGSPLYLAGRLNGPVNYRNATALLFAMPFWPLVVAAASKSYRRFVRAAGLAVATLCLGLVFLTQSRGILLGLAVGGCMVLFAGPDRVRRAWIAGLSIAGVAVASPLLLKPYHAFDGGHGFVTEHDISVAAVGLALLTFAAFGLGLAAALFDNGLRANSPQMGHVRRAARIGLGAALVAIVLAAAVAIGNPITFAHKKWDEFRNLNTTTTSASTRLGTVSGQRYDLWRVALKEFGSAPVLGVGGDNYSFGYYRYRETNRNLNDPHSLVFGLLAEDGAVGTALFLAFLGGTVAMLGRGWRRLSQAERRHAIAPAAAGMVMIGQSTVDWIWLIPGLTAVGIFALAVAAAQAATGEGARNVSIPAPLARALRPGAVLLLLLAAVGVLGLFLSDAYIQRARTQITHPSAELSAAKTASFFDPWSVTPHYLQSSAYESAGNRASAFKQLNDALSIEPQNEATLGVLGDFEARGDHLAAARAYYRRALALNPLDTGLQQLAHIGERRR